MKTALYSVLASSILVTAGWADLPVPVRKSIGGSVTLPSGVEKIQSAAVKLQPEPYIQKFALRANGVEGDRIETLVGQNVNAYFVWNVSAGNPPSPVTQMRISRTLGSGPNVNTTLTTSGGNISLPITSATLPGETVYTLTAVNEAGNVKSASATLNVLSQSQFIAGLSTGGVSADMDHSAEMTNFDLKFSFYNATKAGSIPARLSVHIGHGAAKKATLKENQFILIHPGTNQTLFQNLKIPLPASGESAFTNLTVELKQEDGTLIKAFPFQLRSEQKRTYWIPGT